MIEILGIADSSVLEKKELSVLSVLGLRGKHRKVFSRCRKFHYQMRRKLVGTDFLGLKRVFKSSDEDSIVSTPRSIDTPRGSFSSEGNGTPRSFASRCSEGTTSSQKKEMPKREDSYTLQDQTLVIEDCGYAFSLPPGFNILEDEIEEKEEGPLKRQVSIQLLRRGIDILECSLDFLGPDELLSISMSCRSLFYLSESYWPSSRGLYSERVKNIHMYRENVEKALENIKVLQKQITVWETQDGPQVEKRLITLRKSLCSKEADHDFKEREYQGAIAILRNHKELHTVFYSYDIRRPDSVDSMGSRASRNSFQKSSSGRILLGESPDGRVSFSGSKTPTYSSDRESLTNQIKSPVLVYAKSLNREMVPLKIGPKLTLSKSMGEKKM